MAKKRLKVFMEKVRFKYKVSILNENTLEETFSVRLSWLYVFLLFSTILLLSFFLCSIIIMRTPIRQFIPGFEDVGVKAEVIHHSLRVDSLAEQVALQQDYIHVLSQLVAGEVVVSEIADVDSIIVEQKNLD
jgi:energy-coupling factor transporter transmembrane protein EcfT